jgi:hypothetical protein
MSPFWMRLAVAIASLLVFQSVQAFAEQSSTQAEQARQLHLRLLCALTFGDDFTSPLGGLIFRRCLADPESVFRQRYPGNIPLVKRHPVPLLARPGTPLVGAGDGKGAAPGEQRTPREARPVAHQEPLPLAARVNKANIESSEGTRHYFFWAGPGHVRIGLAFKEMGVFGAPLRQVLSFDFLDERGQVLGHKSIVSESSLERAEISGDFANRQKLIIAVTPQSGLVQMGGYFEIEITGAADFDKSAPNTANVVPKYTRLIKQTEVPLVKNNRSLVGGGVPLR